MIPNNSNIPALCKELQRQQKQRAAVMGTRIMMTNRIRALVAGTLGYSTDMSKAERLKKSKEADMVIKAISKGKEVNNPYSEIVGTVMLCIEKLNEQQTGLEKAMLAIASQLPAADWVQRPEQRGFGMLSMALVVGECGDLSNYPNPAKVWRRMGCAPWTFRGQTLMGASWKSKRYGVLPSDEWERFGYPPRRRSIAFLIGQGLVKQNGRAGGDEDDHNDETELITTPRATGPYRARYDEAKALAIANRPDWTRCAACEGKGKVFKVVGKNKVLKNCDDCAGKGQVFMRCHLHAMLLAAKLLLKNLWIEWHHGGSATRVAA